MSMQKFAVPFGLSKYAARSPRQATKAKRLLKLGAGLEL
jgi:hypothetical protein